MCSYIDAKIEENRKPESINIDSLLNAYKEEANKQNSPEAENRKLDKEHSNHNNPTKESQWKAFPIIKLPEGSRVLEDNKSVVKNDTPCKEKKVKSLTIKSKHQEARDDKSSKILLPVLKVNKNKSFLNTPQPEL